MILDSNVSTLKGTNHKPACLCPTITNCLFAFDHQFLEPCLRIELPLKHNAFEGANDDLSGREHHALPHQLPAHELPFLVGQGDVEVALAVTLERAHKRHDLKVLRQRNLRTCRGPKS